MMIGRVVLAAALGLGAAAPTWHAVPAAFDECPGPLANVSNLVCDPELNTPECDFDGGDCCSSWATCGNGTDHDDFGGQDAEARGCVCVDPNHLAVRPVTFRIVVGATAGFAAQFGNDTNAVKASIAEIAGKVDSFFTRELAVSFDLVDADLVDLDGVLEDAPEDVLAAWPAFLAERNVSSDSFDLAHVIGGFSGGSSVRQGTACGELKALGASGKTVNQTMGELEIELAHRLARQLGAKPTWAYCLRKGEFPVEVGSGASLMSAAGACGRNNVAEQRSMHLHSASIAQIRACLRDPLACGACGARAELDEHQHQPAIDASFNHDAQCRRRRIRKCRVPESTPFRLAVPRTARSPTLSYVWEQAEVGPAAGVFAAQSRDSVLYASSTPRRDTPWRSFPDMRRVRRGMNEVDPRERLPRSQRNMDFVLALHETEPGVQGSAFVSERVEVEFLYWSYEPLRVNISETEVVPGSNLTLHWTKVNMPYSNTGRILLSLDDGETFTVLLVERVDLRAESAQVTVPSPLPGGCGLGFARIRLESLVEDIDGCSFFAINDNTLPVRGCDTTGTEPPPVADEPPQPPPPATEVGPAAGLFDHAGRTGGAVSLAVGDFVPVVVRGAPGMVTMVTFIESYWSSSRIWYDVRPGDDDPDRRSVRLSRTNHVSIFGMEGAGMEIALGNTEERFVAEHIAVSPTEIDLGALDDGAVAVFDHAGRVGTGTAAADGYSRDAKSVKILRVARFHRCELRFRDLGLGKNDIVAVLDAASGLELWKAQGTEQTAEAEFVGPWDTDVMVAFVPGADGSAGFVVEASVPLLMQVGPAPGVFDHKNRVGAEAAADGYAGRAKSRMVVRAASDMPTVLRFTTFSLEMSHDFVAVSEFESGRELWRRSGQITPLMPLVTAAGDDVVVQFEADRFVSYQGFVVEHLSLGAQIELSGVAGKVVFDHKGRLAADAATGDVDRGAAMIARAIAATRKIPTISFVELDLAQNDLLFVREVDSGRLLWRYTPGTGPLRVAGFDGLDLEIVFVPSVPSTTAPDDSQRRGFLAEFENADLPSVGPAAGRFDHLGRTGSSAAVDGYPSIWQSVMIVKGEPGKSTAIRVRDMDLGDDVITIRDVATGAVLLSGDGQEDFRWFFGTTGSDVEVRMETNGGASGEGFLIEHSPVLDVEVGPTAGRVDQKGRLNELAVANKYDPGAALRILVRGKRASILQLRFDDFDVRSGSLVEVRNVGSRKRHVVTAAEPTFTGYLGRDVQILFIAGFGYPGQGFVMQHELEELLTVGPSRTRFDHKGRVGAAAAADGYEKGAASKFVLLGQPPGPSQGRYRHSFKFIARDFGGADWGILRLIRGDLWHDFTSSSFLPFMDLSTDILVQFEAGESTGDGFILECLRFLKINLRPSRGVVDHRGRVGANAVADGYDREEVGSFRFHSRWSETLRLRFTDLDLAPGDIVKVLIYGDDGRAVVDTIELGSSDSGEDIEIFGRSSSDMRLWFRPAWSSEPGGRGFVVEHESLPPPSVGPEPGRFDHKGRTGANATADTYENNFNSVTGVRAAPGKAVRLRFTEFNTDADDEVRVYVRSSEERIWVGSGDLVTPVYVVGPVGEDLIVSFRSNDVFTADGFVVEHEVLDPTTAITSPDGRGKAYDSLVLWKPGDGSTFSQVLTVPDGPSDVVFEITVTVAVLPPGARVSFYDGETLDVDLLTIAAGDDVLPFPIRPGSSRVLVRGEGLQGDQGLLAVRLRHAAGGQCEANGGTNTSAPTSAPTSPSGSGGGEDDDDHDHDNDDDDDDDDHYHDHDNDNDNDNDGSALSIGLGIGGGVLALAVLGAVFAIRRKRQLKGSVDPNEGKLSTDNLTP